MTYAELMRKHATDATNEGGVWFSGEYMSMLATTAESIDSENAKLREFVRDVLRNMHGCTFHHSCGACDFDECLYDARARELGIEARTVQWWATPTNKRRADATANPRKVAERI